jgi:Domain of unknown function (DUF4157)
MSNVNSATIVRVTIVVLVLAAWNTQKSEACFLCVKLGPVTLTPVGPVPTPVVKPVDTAVNKTVVPAAKAAGKAVVAVGTAAVAPQVHIIKVIAGQESLGSAAKGIVESQGAQIAAVGQAVSATNGAVNGITIVAAQSISGNVGQTVMTIVTGPDRLQVEFASTAAIEAGNITSGKEGPEELIAEPLAAGIRAAQNQFQPEAKPIPANVKKLLAPYYPADVLNAARWAVGSVSLSVPDVVNQSAKIFMGVDNAVTVGNVTVFERDPGTNYHWWAHELEHQVQYHDWGIDMFALKYVTSCHEVETQAEDKAKQAVPNGSVVLWC